jgi:hypothetical protein
MLDNNDMRMPLDHRTLSQLMFVAVSNDSLYITTMNDVTLGSMAAQMNQTIN